MKKLITLCILIAYSVAPERSAAQFNTISLTEGKVLRKFPSVATSICRQSEDGVIVSWLEERLNGSIRIQKVGNSGNILWNAGGVVLDNDLGNDFYEELDYPKSFSDMNGGAIVVYRKSDEIFCTLINSDGIPIRSPVNISSYYDGVNYSPKAVHDKKGNIFIVWENFYMGDFNIHAQRVDQNLQKIWNSGEEVSLCKHPADQRKPELTLTGTDGIVVSWLDTRNNGLPDSASYDVYGILLNYSGEVVSNESGSRLFNQRILHRSKDRFINGYNSALTNIEKAIDYKHNVTASRSDIFLTTENIHGDETKDITISKFTSKFELIWQRQVKTGIISEGPYSLSNGYYGLVVTWTDNMEHSGISVLAMDENGKPVDGRNESRDAYCGRSKLKPKADLDHSFNPIAVDRFSMNLYLPWREAGNGELMLNDFCLTDESAGCTRVRSVNQGLTQGGHTSMAILDGNPVIAYDLAQNIFISIRDMPGDLKIEIDRVPKGRIANFPNPFNPSTSIYFEVPNDGFVRLSIYDMTGREISVPVREQKKAGKYSIMFDGSKLASGTYVYQLEHDGKMVTGKMMITK